MGRSTREALRAYQVLTSGSPPTQKYAPSVKLIGFYRVQRNGLYCALWAYAGDLAITTAVLKVGYRAKNVERPPPQLVYAATPNGSAALPPADESLVLARRKRSPRRIVPDDEWRRANPLSTNRFGVFIVLVQTLRELGVLGLHMSFKKTVFLCEEVELRIIERLAFASNDIPAALFTVSQVGKYLGFQVHMDFSHQLRVLYEAPLAKMQQRVEKSPGMGRHHKILMWNIKICPVLSWVAQVSAPDKDTKRKIYDLERFQVQARGAMGVSLDIVHSQQYVYGVEIAPTDFMLEGLAARGRLSLLYSTAQWESFAESMEDCGPQCQQSTWTCVNSASRRPPHPGAPPIY